MTGTYTTSDIIFLRDDIVIDGIDGLQIVLISCQCSHISHTGIHVASTDGMSPCLCLINHRLIALRIDIVTLRLATIVEQELSLVQILLFTRQHIQTGQRHLGNLVARCHTGLSRIGPHLADDAVGITLGNIQELVASSSLIVGTSSIHHVAKVIELVTQNLLHLPTLLA